MNTTELPSRFSRYLSLPAKYAFLALTAVTALNAAETKPAKLFSELSVSAKETFDSNVFGTEANLTGYREVAKIDALVTSVTFKATLDLSGVCSLSPSGPVTGFSIGYTGDYSIYDNATSENNEKHNLNINLKTKDGDWTSVFDTTTTYIDGRKSTIQYKTQSAYSTAMVRERRNQVQNRTKFALRYDAQTWFVRPNANLLFYDLKTDQHQATGIYTGWQNYADRYDLNMGVDVGYKQSKNLAFVVGYRFGTQKQAKFAWDERHNDSNYNRFLVGVEGKVAPWLKLEFLVGPDFREYGDYSHAVIIGKYRTFYYSEGSAIADLSPNDTINLTNKIWQWVSSTGVTAYRETSWIGTYKHKFSSQLSATAGVKVQGSEYAAPTVRNDWVYTPSLGIRYDVSKQLSYSFDWSRGYGRNKIALALAPGRDFMETLISASVRYAF